MKSYFDLNLQINYNFLLIIEIILILIFFNL